MVALTSALGLLQSLEVNSFRIAKHLHFSQLFVIVLNSEIQLKLSGTDWLEYLRILDSQNDQKQVNDQHFSWNSGLLWVLIFAVSENLFLFMVI